MLRDSKNEAAATTIKIVIATAPFWRGQNNVCCLSFGVLIAQGV